jgi:hypothetical protein
MAAPSQNSDPIASAPGACHRRFVLWTLQGCGYLEGYGHHPGSGFMVILLLSGAVAGSDGGWIGSLIGMAAMGCTFGVLYLSGAYSRAKAFHSENTLLPRRPEELLSATAK